jgi:acetoin utilization deacetylase AcuC-like enzyme
MERRPADAIGRDSCESAMGNHGFLIDDAYLRHEPGDRHPESPWRLTAIYQALRSFGAFERWKGVQPRPATLEELALVHHPSLVDRVEKASRQAPARLDMDTVVSSESYRTALFAVGGVLECVDALCSARLRRAIAFVRPPGHHATPAKTMGFCLFNNVALAAAYARWKYKLDRVAVVDFDLHHGNGTQDCFYDDPHVLYVSTHQYPFFPGSGAFQEVGTGEGAGYTVNVPLPAGTGDNTFVPLYGRIVSPILEQYKPQIILVSAGFDAHFSDPLGDLRLTTAAHASVAAALISAAERSCEGRICFVLEGGYSAQALRECSRAVMSEMETDRPQELCIEADPLYESVSSLARRSFGSFWKW